MKRTGLTIAICVFSFAVFGQAQRLALLPYSLKLIDKAGESYLPTLCVDYFNSVPKATDEYFASDALAGTDASNFKIRGRDAHYDRVQIADMQGNTSLPKLDKMTLLKTSGNNESLPAHYSDFINSRIEHYRIGGFTKLKQEKLQGDVWTYNVLDKLGYMDHSINEPLARFQSAKNSFRNDFGSSTKEMSNATILEFGSMLEAIPHYKEKGIASPIVFKSPVSKKYILFNDIAPPIYKGLNEDIVASKINAGSDGDKIIVKTLGFENATKERAFQFDMQSRFDMKFSKEISIISNDVFNESSFLVENANHTILKSFEEDKIVSRGELFKGDMLVKSTREGSTSYVEIDGIAEDKSVLKDFFTTLSDKINGYKEQFKLLFIVQKIKRQAEITKTKRLYVLINQIYAKTFVEIYDGRVVKTYSYACN